MTDAPTTESLVVGQNAEQLAAESAVTVIRFSTSAALEPSDFAGADAPLHIPRSKPEPSRT